MSRDRVQLRTDLYWGFSVFFYLPIVLSHSLCVNRILIQRITLLDVNERKGSMKLLGSRKGGPGEWRLRREKT